MEQDFLLLFPVFFPMAAGLLLFVLPKGKKGRRGKRFFVAAALLLELALTALCLTGVFAGRARKGAADLFPGGCAVPDLCPFVGVAVASGGDLFVPLHGPRGA